MICFPLLLPYIVWYNQNEYMGLIKMTRCELVACLQMNCSSRCTMRRMMIHEKENYLRFVFGAFDAVPYGVQHAGLSAGFPRRR